MPGGSVEHMNPEAGLVWIQRLTPVYVAAAWLNPVPQEHWRYTPSISLVEDALAGRMYPLALAGLDDLMRNLTRKH